MRWTDLESDIIIGDFVHAMRWLDCATAIRLYVNWARGIHIYILRDCKMSVMDHLSSDNKEVGGLLLGRVWEQNNQALNASPPLVVITESVASKEYRNSYVSLEMRTEIWNRANERSSDHLIVDGWYHSHPNLGAFFSGTDRRTQRAFFNHRYSVGWVVDPFRREEKVFVGADASLYSPNLTVLERDLEIP